MLYEATGEACGIIGLAPNSSCPLGVTVSVRKYSHYSGSTTLHKMAWSDITAMIKLTVFRPYLCQMSA